MIDLTYLTTPLSPEDVRKSIYNILQVMGISTTNWKPGATVRTIVSFFSVLLSSFSYWSAAAVNGGFLLLARGDWLTAQAWYGYGTARNDATPATGAVTLTNSGAGVYNFLDGELTLSYAKQQPDGTTTTYYYHNIGAINVTTGSPTPNSQTITLTAELLGSGPSILPGGTVNLVPAYTGLSITVPTAINGSDEETDQSLINRAQLQASSISPNGPRDAYQYVALSAKRLNGSVICTRVSVTNSVPVLVYLGTATAGITGTTGDQTSDLGIVDLAIQTQVVPLGVTAITASGSPINIDIGYQVWVNKNTTFNATAIKTYIANALAAFIGAFPMGGNPVAVVDVDHPTGTYWMYLDAIQSIIEGSMNLPGITNPIYHATCYFYGYALDVQLSPGDIAVDLSDPLYGTVTFQ